MDSMSVCLHQRAFAADICSEGCSFVKSPLRLREGIIRYHKFMCLLSSNVDGRLRNLVPTFDIDLSWHTHQLFGPSYYDWCCAQIGRPIDHDNVACDSEIKKALRDTGLAWYKAYHEGYTSQDLKKEYLSTRRVLTGSLFPLYGLYTIYKASRLDKTRRGKYIYSLSPMQLI